MDALVLACVSACCACVWFLIVRLTFCQQLSESLHFGLKLPDVSNKIFVARRLVLDQLGPLRKLEGGQCLAKGPANANPVHCVNGVSFMLAMVICVYVLCVCVLCCVV